LKTLGPIGPRASRERVNERLFQGYFTKLKCKACPYLTSMSKSAYLLSTSCEKRKCCFYSDPSLYKASKTASLSQSVMPQSTGNISAEGSLQQEQSRSQQHTWYSKPFVIFPLKSTAAHSLHIQHLCVD
jgi:hypothetical protein